MKQKEKGRGEEREKERFIEHEVTVQHQDYGKITMAEGAPISELLKEVEKKYGIRVSEYIIRWNGQEIELENGKPKEDITLEEGGILTLLKAVIGG